MSSRGQTKGTSSLSGKVERYGYHLDSSPRLCSYIRATAKPIFGPRPLSSMISAMSHVREVKQAVFGIVAMRSPVTKSARARTPVFALENCTKSRASEYRMFRSPIHLVKERNALSDQTKRKVFGQIPRNQRISQAFPQPGAIKVTGRFLTNRVSK